MRKLPDPDRLHVSITNGRVFIWFDYEEATSTTLTITPETALRFADCLRAAAGNAGPKYHAVLVENIERDKCAHEELERDPSSLPKEEG